MPLLLKSVKMCVVLLFLFSGFCLFVLVFCLAVYLGFLLGLVFCLFFSFKWFYIGHKESITCIFKKENVNYADNW